MYPVKISAETTASGVRHPHLNQGLCFIAIIVAPNAKVSDGSQPPMTWYLSVSESAGSRSLHRLVGSSW